jgi:hypothetical protein
MTTPAEADEPPIWRVRWVDSRVTGGWDKVADALADAGIREIVSVGFIADDRPDSIVLVQTRSVDGVWLSDTIAIPRAVILEVDAWAPHNRILGAPPVDEPSV